MHNSSADHRMPVVRNPAAASRPRSAYVAFLTLVPCLLHAQVIVQPRVFGTGLRGPAHADVSALAWNPAALGLLDGFHVYAEGGATLGWGTLAREPLDEFPDDDTDPERTFNSADYDSLSQGYFLGMSVEMPGQPITLGIAGYTPFVESAEHGDWPGSYYRRDVDWVHLTAPTFAVSYRAASSLLFGVGLNINWSWLHTSFDRDLTIEGGTAALAVDGYENEEAAQNIVIETRGGPDVTAALGVLYRPKRTMNIGVSWQLRPQPVRTTGSVRVVERRGSFQGRASAEYELPDVVNVGLEWRATEKLTTALTLRYISARLHDELKIRPSGTGLVAVDENGEEEPVVPESIVFHRGFGDLWALDGAASYAVLPALELGLGAFVETAAVGERKVNPAQVDGPKFAGRTFALWRLAPWLSLGATWEMTVMGDRVVNDSDFDPQAGIRCVDSGYNVDDCDELSEGRALSDPRGRYQFVAHRIMGGISLDRW